MTYPYLPHTDADISAMLDVCGLNSIEQLLEIIPGELRLSRPYRLPEQMSEPEVRQFFSRLADECHVMTCFAGNGFYAHWHPAAVASIISRSEFLTAYTPYQPEISQGTLQYIFEYQTIMSRLTGLPISNASLYDGATATAEAALMMVAAARKHNRILISATVNQAVAEVVATYCDYHGIALTVLDEVDGVTSVEALDNALAANDVAGVIVASPNKYGILEDYNGWAERIHAAKALLAMNCIAADLATIRTPGEWGADIAVGDAQSLGMPLNFGGPYLGYMTTTEALVRKMPGRIVGATTDRDDKRSFVLTLQAREQHIRREKATSNICSNQGIMALYVAAYTSLLGTEGLRTVNRLGAAAVRELTRQLVETGYFKLTYPDKPYLNEVSLSTSVDINGLLRVLADNGILGGVKIGEGKLLVAATEMQSVEEIARYINIVKAYLQSGNGSNNQIIQS